MAKKDAFTYYNDSDIQHMQVIYLNHYRIPLNKIAEITRYAISTIKNYINKFAHLLEKALKTFYHIGQELLKSIREHNNFVYLFKFYTEEGAFRYSKVGEVHNQTIKKRLGQEEREYGLQGKICSVIDTDKIPSRGLECYIQGLFIKKYATEYIPTDRFAVDIDIDEFDKLAKDFMGKNFVKVVQFTFT